jgi:hypothetical protein
MIILDSLKTERHSEVEDRNLAFISYSLTLISKSLKNGLFIERFSVNRGKRERERDRVNSLKKIKRLRVFE